MPLPRRAGNGKVVFSPSRRGKGGVLFMRENLVKSSHFFPEFDAECARENAANATLAGIECRRPAIHAAPDCGLDERATFDRLVPGAGNVGAINATHSVLASPGQGFNPLYIFGRPGLGKTHLLQALGHGLLARGIPAVYVTCERFLNEMIACLATKRMRDFRAKYRGCGALLIDDIQFLANKAAMQEEFLHTFNALHAAKCQIAVVSDVPPSRIDNLEERLRTRFDWGLIVEVQPPDEGQSIAILHAKAKERGFELSEEAALVLAGLGHCDIRRLECLCNTLAVSAQTLQRKEFDADATRFALRGTGLDRVRTISVESIVAKTAKAAGLSPRDLKSTLRKRVAVDARHVAMFLCRKYTRSSFAEIAAAFGGRDHSSVVHAVQRVREASDKDFDVKHLLESAERAL